MLFSPIERRTNLYNRSTVYFFFPNSLSTKCNKIHLFHSTIRSVLIIRGNSTSRGANWQSYPLKKFSCCFPLLTSPVICLYFPGYPKEGSWFEEGKEKGKVQRYFCPRCCSSFSKKANMLTHFRYECGKEPRFQCPYCGKRDRKSSNTYRHIRTCHKGSRIQAYRLYWESLDRSMEKKRLHDIIDLRFLFQVHVCFEID